MKRWKNDERLLLSFHFVLFVLNVIIFVYNGLKQSHILQTMPNRLLQIYFFHRNLIYVYLKNSIFAVCEETWVWVCHYVSHIGLHLLFWISEICFNLTRYLFWKFSHSILSKSGKITHRFFYKSMFSEVGLKSHPKRRKQFF